MFTIYQWSTVGSAATDWANDGLFGDGWHLFGIGSNGVQRQAAGDYTAAAQAVQAFTDIDVTADDFDTDEALSEMKSFTTDSKTATVDVEDEETLGCNMTDDGLLLRGSLGPFKGTKRKKPLQCPIKMLLHVF